MNSEAVKLKNEGNALFSKREYPRAESCYSRAIVLDPNLTSLYTNRAMCRFHMKQFDGVISDCEACLALDPGSVKANYYMSKGLSALGDHETACARASVAYDICRGVGGGPGEEKSLGMTHDWLLQCKADRWRWLERKRRREAQDLEAEVLALLARERDDAVGGVAGDDVERAAVWEENEKKMEQVKAIFERARADDDKERQVPDWLVDDISFEVMTDPVITKSGRSYERSSITAAINANAVDPITREPLTKNELRPNIVLKQACEWFLNSNGWAYDW